MDRVRVLFYKDEVPVMTALSAELMLQGILDLIEYISDMDPQEYLHPNDQGYTELWFEFEFQLAGLRWNETSPPSDFVLDDMEFSMEDNPYLYEYDDEVMPRSEHDILRDPDQFDYESHDLLMQCLRDDDWRDFWTDGGEHYGHNDW